MLVCIIMNPLCVACVFHYGCYVSCMRVRCRLCVGCVFVVDVGLVVVCVVVCSIVADDVNSNGVDFAPVLSVFGEIEAGEEETLSFPKQLVVGVGAPYAEIESVNRFRSPQYCSSSSFTFKS